MKPIPYTEAGSFDVVEILDAVCLYTEDRIEKESLPEGFYLYETRTDSTHGIPLTLEHSVKVNFSGSVITNTELKLPEDEDSFWDIKGKFFFTGCSISPDLLPHFNFKLRPVIKIEPETDGRFNIRTEE